MTKITKRIEIVASTARSLNSMSLKSREAIQAILSRHYAAAEITIINTLPDLEALVARKPDMVFLGMKFIPSDPALGLRDPNKIWLSKYLSDHGIMHTGSDHSAHELELNKQLGKQRALDAGLKTARFHVAVAGELPLEAAMTLGYPVFIKPTDRGGGLGVDSGSLAYDYAQLRTKVQSLAADLQSDALIEEYLPGREFSVGILKDTESGYYSVMPIELVAPLDRSGERFLSAQIKSADTEGNLAVTDEPLRAKLNELAIDVFHALGARDYGRIDIRLDAAGTPHFLEANLLPSLLDGYGNFPKTCMLNIHLRYEPMILQIVQLAFDRDLTMPEYVLGEVLLPGTAPILAFTA